MGIYKFLSFWEALNESQHYNLFIMKLKKIIIKKIR